VKYYKNRRQQHIDVVSYGIDTKNFNKIEFLDGYKKPPRWRQISIALGGEGWHKK